MGRDKKPPVAAHIRIKLDILSSPAYIALEYSAKALYLDLRFKLRSSNNGNISASFNDLKHRGWRSPTTLAKALRQLEAIGLLAKTRKTIGVQNGSTLCNLYRFTDEPVNRRPDLQIESQRATHDYKRIDSLRLAKSLIKQAKQASAKKKSTLQKLASNATDIEVKRGKGQVMQFHPTPETVEIQTQSANDFSHEIKRLSAA